MHDSVIRLGRRAAADPTFWAFALAKFAEREGWDESTLTEKLGITLETLTALRLCRSPRDGGDLFRADLELVTERYGLNRELLANIARHGQWIVELAKSPALSAKDASAAYIAARDREQAE